MCILGKYGYSIARQRESHIRLKSELVGYEHSITIPAHNPWIGTLNKILTDVATYMKNKKGKTV